MHKIVNGVVARARRPECRLVRRRRSIIDTSVDALEILIVLVEFRNAYRYGLETITKIALNVPLQILRTLHFEDWTAGTLLMLFGDLLIRYFCFSPPVLILQCLAVQGPGVTRGADGGAKVFNPQCFGKKFGTGWLMRTDLVIANVSMTASQ